MELQVIPTFRTACLVSHFIWEAGRADWQHSSWLTRYACVVHHYIDEDVLRKQSFYVSMSQADDSMERGDVIRYRLYHSVGLILGVIGIFLGLAAFALFYKYVFPVWYLYLYLTVEPEYKFPQHSVKSSSRVEEADIYVVNVLWTQSLLYLYFIIVGNKLSYCMINSTRVELQLKKIRALCASLEWLEQYLQTPNTHIVNGEETGQSTLY